MIRLLDFKYVSLAECSTHEIHLFIQLSCSLGTYKKSELKFWKWRTQDGICGSTWSKNGQRKSSSAGKYFVPSPMRVLCAHNVLYTFCSICCCSSADMQLLELTSKWCIVTWRYTTSIYGIHTLCTYKTCSDTVNHVFLLLYVSCYIGGRVKGLRR